MAIHGVPGARFACFWLLRQAALVNKEDYAKPLAAGKAEPAPDRQKRHFAYTAGNNPGMTRDQDGFSKMVDRRAPYSAMPLSLRRSPYVHITTSRTSSLVTEKILEENRVYGVFFFHQEKSFQDHYVSWVLGCDLMSREHAEET